MTYSLQCIQHGYDGRELSKGNWTLCSCGHIAQNHSKEGWCEVCNPSLAFITRKEKPPESNNMPDGAK